MVAGDAASDAVARARRMPKLGVGLHLVLTRGRPCLDPAQIPDLVDARGEFARDLFRAGVNFFFRPAARAQLEAEIRAQFEAFRRTGLKLDHVNGHNHIHLHPTVIGLVLKLGREFGLSAVRVPYEPPLVSFLAAKEGFWRRLLPALGLLPWAAYLKWRIRRAGLGCNDYVFGIFDSGHMTAARISGFVSRLPAGVSEIYLHPAVAGWNGGDESAAGYDGAGELAALLDPRLAELLRKRGIAATAFSGLAAGAAR
jgi:hopanoid biosynthesis associated protein HpnK